MAARLAVGTAAALLLLLGVIAPAEAPAAPTYPAGTTSKRKCEEYGRIVSGADGSVRPWLPTEIRCFLNLPIAVVVGGLAATLYEFPHMAAVGFGDSKRRRWLCGGALISERYVLTAAHCLEDKLKPGRRNEGPAQWVRLGDLDLASLVDDQNVQDFSVESRIAHPDYKDDVKYNDIGLLRLDRDVVIGNAVRPACLHTLVDPVPATASATGWGRLDEDGPLADRLQRIDLPLVQQEQCRQHFDPIKTTSYREVLRDGIVGTMLCAGGQKAGGRDTCAGDSGGPLQVLQDSPYCTYSVVGVTSFGKGCARPGVPAVYTRVAEFVPWIESIVWPSSISRLK